MILQSRTDREHVGVRHWQKEVRVYETPLLSFASVFCILQSEKLLTQSEISLHRCSNLNYFLTLKEKKYDSIFIEIWLTMT